MPNIPLNSAAETFTQVEEEMRTPECGASIACVPHHGWEKSYRLSNGIVEAIVVPAIGRVIQFRLAGDAGGTFWENRALDGRLHHSDSDEWFNFGGDKCWPAPQSAWPRQQGRHWPPPPAFDAGPMQAEIEGDVLVLTSRIDPGWGLQVVRRVELEPNLPVMRIRTEYRKVQGPTVRAAIWTITQMQEPECVCMLLESESRFAKGYVRLLDAAPAGLEIQESETGSRVLRLARHRSAYTKIGADGASLAWIGPASVMRIDVEQMPGEYPDGGCLTEIYTNPDPLHYVELETLGPLMTLCAGDAMQHNVLYTLWPRTCVDPWAEAQKVFGA